MYFKGFQIPSLQNQTELSSQLPLDKGQYLCFVILPV